MSEPSPAISALAASFRAGQTPGKAQEPLSPATAALARSFAWPRPAKQDRAEFRRFARVFGTQNAAAYYARGLSFEAACEEHRAAGLTRKPTAFERSGGGVLGALAQSYADRD